MIMDIRINRLGPAAAPPFDLLLLADETMEAIEKYIYDSDVYTVTSAEYPGPVAVFALYGNSDTELEIKNIAVAKQLQGKGIGSALIGSIRDIGRNSGFKTLVVGTPDTDIQQLNFYRRNGFEQYAVKKDFYLNHYPSPIIENGVMLKDMAMLKMEL